MKRLLLLITLTALLVPWAVNASELTLHNGTATSQHVPMYVFYFDDFTRSQYVIPSSELTVVAGKEITAITYYTTSSNVPYTTVSSVDIYLKEVGATSISAFEDKSFSTIVYQGIVEFISQDDGGVATIEFTTPFQYNGGNLMIGCDNTTDAGYKNLSFYGESVSGASVAGYNSNNLANVTANAESFLPKVTITYGAPSACPKPSSFDASNITATGATLAWADGSGSFNVEYKKASDSEWTQLLSSTSELSSDLTSLEPATSYQARVQSVCGGETSGWKTISFDTPCESVSSFPWNEDFNSLTVAGSIPSCWDNTDGTTTSASYKWCFNTSTSGNGAASGTSHDGSNCLVFNSYSNSSNNTNFLKTPEINLPASPAMRLNFWYKNPAGGDFSVYISTDGGATYTTALASGLTGASAWIKHEDIDLSAYAGQSVIIVFKGTSNWGSGDAYIYLDDVAISEIPSCLTPTNLSASNITTNSAELSWTNGGTESAWKLFYKKSTESDYTEVNNVTNPYSLSGLASGSVYQFYVKAVCGSSEESDASIVASFSTPFSTPFSEKFSGTSIPAEWSLASGLLSAVAANSAALSSATYGWSFGMGNGVFDNHARANVYGSSCSKWLMTPEIEMSDGVQLTFDLALTAYDGTLVAPATIGTDDKFIVLISTDNKVSWTILRQWDNAGSEYVYNNIASSVNGEEVTIDLSSYNSGKVIFAFYCESTVENADNNLHIDNIKIDVPPTCFKPLELAVSAITAEGATFSWNANGMSAWQYVVVAKDADVDWSTATDVATNSAVVAGKEQNTSYDFYVRAACAGNQFSEDVKLNFRTECQERANSYSYDFEEANEFLCWSVGNVQSGTSYIPYISSSSSYAKSGTHSLYMNAYVSSGYYSTNADSAYAILPTINFGTKGVQGYTLSFYARSSSGSNYYKHLLIGVVSGKDINSFELVEDLTLTTSYPSEPYEIPFADYTGSGDHIAILAVVNPSSTADYNYGQHYLDDVNVFETPSCVKPKALMLETPSSRTAHTATLKWTNGSEGQNAWQIAYSTEADFSPADVIPVDVTTNPATIEGLAQSTTYYAYVRANCGNGDYSAWSTTKATFTTLAGNVTPSGLAVEASTITSSQATASWNAVAGNTLHESYDIYWAESTVTAVPDEPAAPNFISGITATSQDITGLESETQYKVWVRDNCGTDGLSSWSSPVSFTTAASCQTPDGLAAADITVSSASISWNTYGQTGFNLRYGTDGENWTLESGISSPYALSGLTSNTAYQVQVQATCGEEWSSALNFRTKCVALSTFPWEEDFEDFDASSSGVKLEDPCWENIHLSGSGTYFFEVYSGTNGTNSTKQLRLHDMASGTMTKLMLPSMTLPNDNYQFVLDVYRNDNYSSYTEEGIRVYVSTNGEIEDATELAFIPRVYSVSNSVIPSEAATGWYTYELPLGIDGSCFIILRGESKYGAATYMDNFVVKEIPSCIKPSELAVDNVTNASAVATWAVGDANKWNLRYKKTTDSDWTLVGDLTAATHTLENLDATTEYEVQVQANCGVNGTSEWTASVSFTTALCAPDDQCLLTFELTDQYDDSWNGNAIKVVDVASGNVLGTLTNDHDGGSWSSYTQTKTLSVCNGREIQFSWVTGSYPGETSYVVKDVNGHEIFSGSGAMSDPVNYIVDCSHKFYLEIGASGYATFYDEDYAYTMPANLSGHVFSTQNVPEMLVEEYAAGAVIPVATPLVMKAADGVTLPYTFVLSESDEAGVAPFAFNQLYGVNEYTPIIENEAGYYYYVLSLNAANNVDSVGFYWMNATGEGGFEMPAHKAYLKLLKPTDPTSAPAAFYLFNGENGATWLDNLQGVEGTVKFMHEGNIYILRDSIIYDATGRKVRELK